MSNKTWGLTETGSVYHSFKADGVAICRSNVKAGRDFQRNGGRDESAVDRVTEANPHLFRKCASCAKREAAFRARVEASMQPVGEYDQVCEGVEGFGNAAADTEVVETYEVQDETVIVLAGDPAPVDEDEDEDEDEDDEPDVDGAGRTYAEYHPELPKRSGRAVTQKPVIRAMVGEARPAFGSDPLRPPTPEPLAQQPTAEEARAEVVKRFPRGTRVQGPDSSGTWRSGVVNGYDLGTVTEPGHVNEGRIFIGVTWDAVPGDAGCNRRSRPFADELITAEEARAEVVKRFPRGTVVMWTDGSGLVRHGVVNGLDVGTVTEPGHVNEGRVYVGVDAEPLRAGEGWAVRTRLFADMLTGPDENAVRDALGL